jgi:hypothetical protein
MDKIKCFDEEFDRRRPHASFDGGLRVIQVKRITGTVNKCGELDSTFQYIRRKDRLERSRRYRLQRAVSGYMIIPPISVYLNNGEYYVIDGNRRVAAALQAGIEFIDAYVTEIVYRDDPMSIRGAISRRKFESRTGITTIELSHEIGYNSLFREVARAAELQYSAAPGEDPLKAAARAWYTERYLPAIEAIRKSVLLRVYQGHQVGDLYVLVADFHERFMEGRPENPGMDLLISAFLFAHHVPRRSPLKSILYSAVRSLIGWNRKLEWAP